MRVLTINHEFPPLGGGGANANYYIARELVEQGHKVTVVTSRLGDLPAAEVVDGVEVIRLGCLRKNTSHTTLPECAGWVARATAFCSRWAAANRPDVVQAFFTLPNGPVAWAAARTARCPFVVRLAGGDVPGNDPTRYSRTLKLLMPATRWVLRRASARVVNSRGLLEKAQAAYPDLDFTVIPNGIDLDEFCPLPDQRNGQPPRLLFVSRLVERKGLQFLLPALANLHDQGMRFSLRIVGDGPMMPEVERLVAETGIGECVRIDGAVAHDELCDIYCEADLFVLPSLAEGMPNVMLEAISCGLPAIGTRVAGMDELIEEGSNGWLVDAGDIESLQTALAEALSDSERTAEMGAASRKVAETMSWSRIARAYEETMTGLLKGKQDGKVTERVDQR